MHAIDGVVHNQVRVLPADLFGTNSGTRVTEDAMNKQTQNSYNRYFIHFYYS